MIPRFILTNGGLIALMPNPLSVAGMADFRTWFATSGLDARQNGDNVPDRELIHIHKPYLKRDKSWPF